jgi:hypothetical protein
MLSRKAPLYHGIALELEKILTCVLVDSVLYVGD